MILFVAKTYSPCKLPVVMNCVYVCEETRLPTARVRKKYAYWFATQPVSLSLTSSFHGSCICTLANGTCDFKRHYRWLSQIHSIILAGLIH